MDHEKKFYLSLYMQERLRVGRGNDTIPPYVQTTSTCNHTRIMVTIKKRAGVIPYSFSSSIALLSSLLSCSFYLLDLRTISSVDILEMT